MKYLVQMPKMGRFSTHRGEIDFQNIIGKEYGDSIETHLGCRFYLLKPTLADMAIKVKRTTTIVYPKDAGMMLLQAAVFPGARVIEVGSGSGALTLILANFVRPSGKVYSYERRSEFSVNAQANVARYGLEGFCEFFVCDPEKDGFGQAAIDAVFLDVPEPWVLVNPAHKALKGGFSLVAIVPTAEQLRKLVSCLELEGFSRIRIMETLERNMLVRPSGTRPADRMVGHTIYMVFAHKVNRE